MAPAPKRRRTGEEVEVGKVVPRRKSRKEIERIFYRAIDEKDPLNRIEAWQQVLEHLVADIDEAVITAWEDNASWADVGKAIGTSRQNAQQRFGPRLGLRSE